MPPTMPPPKPGWPMALLPERVQLVSDSVPSFPMPPPLPPTMVLKKSPAKAAVLPERVTSVSDSVPAFQMPAPPSRALPLARVSRSRPTVASALTSKIRLAPWASRVTPPEGPVIVVVAASVNAGSWLPLSVMVPLTEKSMVSAPALAFARVMAAHSVPALASSDRLVTWNSAGTRRSSSASSRGRQAGDLRTVWG